MWYIPRLPIGCKSFHVYPLALCRPLRKYLHWRSWSCNLHLFNRLQENPSQSQKAFSGDSGRGIAYSCYVILGLCGR